MAILKVRPCLLFLLEMSARRALVCVGYLRSAVAPRAPIAQVQR